MNMIVKKHRVLGSDESIGYRRIQYIVHRSAPKVAFWLIAGLAVGVAIAAFLNALELPTSVGHWLFSAMSTGAFFGLTVGAWKVYDIVCELAPLNSRELLELAKIAEESPSVRSWAREAIENRLEFLQRDLAVARIMHEGDRELQALQSEPNDHLSARQRIADAVCAQRIDVT